MATQMLTKLDGNNQRRGFWLVRAFDQARYFVAPTVSVAALDRVCEVVLNEKVGWDYWIDFCLGLDCKGSVVWTNLDLTDRFI